VDLSITRSAQAEHIINTRQADAILIALEFLREPYWPLCAAQELRQSVSWPMQYVRAAPSDAHARSRESRQNKILLRRTTTPSRSGVD
jgi:2,4-dienoyl-CoA reductase-like NADH-dependent reductase (Old Yellow Enzyme family)